MTTQAKMPPTKEETKEPEPSQTVEPAGAAMSAPPRVNQQTIESVQQSADAIQATLQAV